MLAALKKMQAGTPELAGRDLHGTRSGPSQQCAGQKSAGGRATVRARWWPALLIAVLKNLQRGDLRLLAEIYMALGPDRVSNVCIPRLDPSTNMGKKKRRSANAPPVFSER